MSDRMPPEQAARYTVDMIDKTIKAFDGIGKEMIFKDPLYELALVGGLVLIGEHLDENSNVASPDLAKRFGDLRNDMAHEYGGDEVWEAFKQLPKLRKDVVRRQNDRDRFARQARNRGKRQGH